MKKNTRAYGVALVLFAAGVGYLAYAGLKDGSAYHLDVAQALAMKSENVRGLRVFGSIAAANRERTPGSAGIRFFLEDRLNPATVMEVVYAGAVPEGFKPGAEIYVEGSREPESGVFRATGLTATCPSKYKKENRK